MGVLAKAKVPTLIYKLKSLKNGKLPQIPFFLSKFLPLIFYFINN